MKQDDWYPRGFSAPRTDEQLRGVGRSVRLLRDDLSVDPDWDLAIGTQDERVPRYLHVSIDELKPVKNE